MRLFCLRSTNLQTPTVSPLAASCRKAVHLGLASQKTFCSRLWTKRMASSAQALDYDHDVTRANFSDKLPAIRQALQECNFYSFDLEMTGLFMDSCHANPLDDMQDRYAKVRDNSSSFEISQFGLSCFKLSQDGRSYEAKTFNAYVFPEPMAFDLSGGLSTRKFMCDAGAVSFLAHEGFDFNKWVRQGISYLPLKQYEQHMQQIQLGNQQPRSQVAVDKLRDIEFVARLLDEVKAWLAGDEPVLQLTLANSFERLLCYQELSKKSNFVADPEGSSKEAEETRGEAPSPDEAQPGVTDKAQGQEDVAEQAWHRGFFIKKVEVNGMGQLQLIRTPTPADLERVVAEDQAERIAAIKGAAGFSAVMEAMRDCRRPAVGHNCLFDIMFMMAAFVDPRLPRHWDDAKKLVAAWFPGGIYDTKHLASLLPDEMLLHETSLGQLFSNLTRKDTPQRGAAAAAMKFLSGNMDMSLAVPEVRHAGGFTQYVNAETGANAHEAGYDAFMTGAVFSILAPLVHAASLSQSSGRPMVGPPEAEQDGPSAMDVSEKEDDAASQGSWDIAAQYQPLPYITQHVGRLNISRSDMPYVAIWGKDPVLNRPYVLHLVNQGPSNVHPNDVARRLQAAGAPGRPKVSGLPSSSVMGGYLAEMDVAAMKEAGLSMDELREKLQASMSSVSPTAWQVQVQEMGEGVATGRGVGPWMIQSWVDFSAQKQQLLLESQVAERGGRSAKRSRVAAAQETPQPAAEPSSMSSVMSKCTIS
ncbi:ribonuclease H-like domain-containing protein [Dunaliella salina]|uniref:Ribonuclease H-like domain-containing protein n=1 Tax=Dunaliella salina TaxID=3046 RepID=A0ABQ7G3U3_DUNSA|nr:ribonuclease H-like domain-containing protein [Dunaliella salina]|eukprot:KAF5829284.1 ribonuclease H-like domain-containing protein [Dunaliella salina]